MSTAPHERRVVVPRVILEHDVAAKMSDGTVLRADIFRPDTTEPCPVLLCRTPYGKHDATANPFLGAVDAARHGYIIALQDVRGRGCSDGDWKPFVNEFDDGADSVAWAADLPGSDGTVGMFGSSYVGFTQWAAATRQPAALRALVPALTWSDTRNGLLERGGTPETGLTSYLHHYGFADGFPDPEAVDSLATPSLRSPEGVSFTDGIDPRVCSIPNGSHDPATTMPALNIAGWYDVFLAGTLEHHQRARAGGTSAPGRASRLIVGPWSHVNFTSVSGTHSFGERATFAQLAGTGMSALVLDWFDHWLRDRPYQHPWLTGPAVHAFDMGTNRWVAHDTWPPAQSRTSIWTIAAAGTLRPAVDGSNHRVPLKITRGGGSSWPGGAVHMHPSQPAGVIDQRTRPRRDGEQHFTSPVLTDELTLAGPVSVRLGRTRVDRASDVVARLSVVHSDGFERNLTDGVRRIEPREEGWDRRVDLWSTYATITRGQRLGLTISTSGWPRWGSLPNAPSTVEVEQVLLEYTHLTSRERRRT